MRDAKFSSFHSHRSQSLAQPLLAKIEPSSPTTTHKMGQHQSRPASPAKQASKPKVDPAPPTNRPPTPAPTIGYVFPLPSHKAVPPNTTPAQPTRSKSSTTPPTALQPQTQPQTPSKTTSPNCTPRSKPCATTSPPSSSSCPPKNRP